MKLDTNQTWELLIDAYRAARKAGAVNGWETDSVFISEVQRRFTMADHRGKELTREDMLTTLNAKEGAYTLDQGDWSHATEEQREAHIMLRDRERLYIRLH